MPEKTIIFFDGECRFCIGWIRFLIDRDGQDRLRFASLQSKWSERFFQKEDYPLPERPSIIIFKRGSFHSASEAIAEIAEELPGIWQWGKHIKGLPFSIRNRAYHWIAARRYKFFGKKDACWIPTEEIKAKFLDL